MIDGLALFSYCYANTHVVADSTISEHHTISLQGPPRLACTRIGHEKEREGEREGREGEGGRDHSSDRDSCLAASHLNCGKDHWA